MRLLFDQNLSPRLVKELSRIYEGLVHVRDLNLQAADDETVWKTASQKGLIIISKDADFHQRSFLYGHPPKVIWVRCGNCSTSDIKRLLIFHRNTIEKFSKDKQTSFLVLP